MIARICFIGLWLSFVAESMRLRSRKILVETGESLDAKRRNTQSVYQ